ncbi:hypothetical protein MNEG_15127, partial [Monoraphidium neglectum]
EFVPVQPAIANSYTAILHIARTLPHLLAAADAGAGGAGAGAGGAAPYARCCAGPAARGVGAALAAQVARDPAL